MEESGYVRELRADDSAEARGRLENLQELIGVAREYESGENAGSLEDFLANVALISDLDSLDADTSYMTLMTMHSAKGLEFPIVFMTGLEEGVFPHTRALTDNDELEEERRLAYVGVTRAMERLFLSYAMRRSLSATRSRIRSRASSKKCRPSSTSVSFPRVHARRAAVGARSRSTRARAPGST